MKRVLVGFVAVVLLSWMALAQEKGTSKQDEAQAAASSRGGDARPRDTYKLDFTVTELEDGKKLNARTYSLMCENPRTDVGGARWGAHMRVGSRVPVATAVPTAPGVNTNGGGALPPPTSIQYIDVGMNIDANVNTLEDGTLTLYSMVEMSSVADNPSSAGNFAPAPVIRQLRASTNSALTPGKPIVLSTADDVGSKRRFEVQVMATKVNAR